MSSRVEVYHYSVEHLHRLIPHSVKLLVGGIPIDAADLVKAGWHCRVAIKSRGTSRITFHGPDGRSTISFRVDARGKDVGMQTSPEYILSNLPEGIITVIPKPRVVGPEWKRFSATNATDQSVLEDLLVKIQSRRKQRRPKKDILSRAVEFVEAA